MTPSATRLLRVGAAAAALSLALAARAAGATTIEWTIKIVPSSSGQVTWTTSSPPGNGVLQKSGKISFDEGAYVDLTFRAASGYELLRVLKNGADFTGSLDGSGHYRFGPVDGRHTFVAVFSALTPTGTFDFRTPAGDRSVTGMVDLTGSYTGVSPTKYRRAYAFDVAMDEAGKITGMGTAAGIVPRGGGNLAGTVGGVRTVGGTPILDGAASFAGTRDGADASGRASVTGPAELTDVGGQPTASGSLTYSGQVDGVPVADANVPVSTTVDPANAANVRRSWWVRVLVRKGPTAKPRVLASAELHLPNGDTIVFPEKAAKYSPTKGYKLKFAKGTNQTRVPPVLDKRSKVTLLGMTLALQGSTWSPTAGTIQYSFLGQKGTADLMKFVE